MKELIYPRLFYPAVDMYGDREVMVSGEHRATMSEHADRVLRLCDALDTLGVAAKDRFAVMALNGHQFEELYHAAFLGAGVINPLNLRLAGKELDYIIRDSGTEVIFVDVWFAGLIDQAITQSGDSPLRHIVLIGDGDVPHTDNYEDLLASATPTRPTEPEEDSPVVLMYTGGTTGLPKGVLLDQRAEMLNVYHSGFALGGIDENAVYLMQTPMFHAASMVGILAMAPLGGKTVFLPLFDPGAALALSAAEQVTQTVMVPTMVGMILQHPDYSPEKLASWKVLTYGASPMPAAILDKLLHDMPDVELSQGYGMTEASAVLTFLTAKDHFVGNPRLRSVGQPVVGVELSIQDGEGNILPQGEIGEVCAKAGNFMIEYWNKPDATEEVFEGGWYHSGDAGYLDEGGYLFLVDRVKDMIISGGENVYSAEVESAISTHPAVAQVAVIGIPHDLWGEQVHAIVVPNEGAEVTEEEIIEYARESIAGYKLPKSVDFRAEPLPLSGAMKVLKRELRAPYWEGHEKGIN
ncbi:MAG: AMP-binding protein [Actinomycetia bacterium]|nr:AMP-binding protein [Actinomycetes bacterium]MCP4959277.1 AMP-binding protein [Actinomycetes bacterium]